MLNFVKLRKYSYYILFLFFLNQLLVESNYNILPLNTLKEDDLKPLSINYYLTDDYIKQCQFIIPSLFFPVIMVSFLFDPKDLPELKTTPTIYSPITSEIKTKSYNYNLLNKYNFTLLKEFGTKINKNECFFGLSKLGNSSMINETDINLNILMNGNKNIKPIFSFDKWHLNGDNITSSLFLGGEHENFTNNNGVVGSCNVDKEDYYWGCSFKQMIFHDKTIQLINNEGSFYKIFFSSETHKIIFPRSFKTTFDKAINSICEESSQGLSCPDLFMSKKDYINLKLIDDHMIITTEIDNLKRYSPDNQMKSNQTRIIFENIDYFVFPLIMFKNFLVQFDLDKEIISFFTTDESILEIIKNDSNKEYNSNIGTIFLIIFIILLILALGFGLFWFIKKRGSSVEKNINKYNKFEEDEEVLKEMNDKRVF